MEGLARGFRFLFDRRNGARNGLLARWIFLRALGLIYFSAFFALLFQIKGLIGSEGILPANEYLQALHRLGAERFFLVPTVLWMGSGSGALMALCWVGLIASLLVIGNLAPRLSLLVCFVCFLSFISVSQDFGQYQSDGMLLAAGFLALFYAPGGWWPRLGRSSLPVRAATWLLLWEWFRIYFESGVVKLASGDPTWRNLTAMYEYYQNGPLPTWVGWYLQHLPHWFQMATAAMTLVMELVLVFMAFGPRWMRIACFWTVTVWQVGVILTANYAFLNYLVLALGFLLLDDAYIARFVPEKWRTRWIEERELVVQNEVQASEGIAETENAAKPATPVRIAGVVAAAVFLCWVGYVTTVELVEMFVPSRIFPQTPIAALEPFRIANEYGLFATMTPHRYEIEFQGSQDGTTWTAYPFRYKPQDINERPRIYAPYQPRFDWNLWFASLESWEQSPIVPLTEERLLEGDRDVLGLFRGNPFSQQPPRYVRAVLWQYWFTSWPEKRATGAWWRRQLLGTFAPTIEKLPNGKFGVVATPDLDGPPA